MTKKPAPRPSRRMLAWVIPIVAVAVLGGFLAGERAGRSAPDALAPDAAAPAAAGAVDISKMSPQERASRLYDKVMQYGELGRLDSVRTFAPMALQAYAALGVEDAHTHYDVGMIWAMAGDSVRARSEAAKILDQRPTHLLGLLLAARSAANGTLRATYLRRFADASKAEFAAALPEYDEHRHDIEGALRAAQTPRK